MDFDREIRPILSEHCYACHGPDQKARKADLRLDRKEDAFRDRGGYAAIVPGKVEESELIARITSGDPDEMMPPPKFKKRLDAKQIELLRRWVAEGAKWEGHWSLALPGERADAAGGGPILAAQPDRSFRARPAGGRGIASDGPRPIAPP